VLVRENSCHWRSLCLVAARKGDCANIMTTRYSLLLDRHPHSLWCHHRYELGLASAGAGVEHADQLCRLHWTIRVGHKAESIRLKLQARQAGIQIGQPLLVHAEYRRNQQIGTADHFLTIGKWSDVLCLHYAMIILRSNM
jgi:hypothetical protein